MDNMVRPPRRPQSPVPRATPPQSVAQLPPAEPLSTTDADVSLQSAARPALGRDARPIPRSSRKVWTSILIITGVFAVAALGVLWTYRELLKPVDSSDDTAQKIVIESGQGFSSVADTLEARSLIRSKLAFSVMARLSGAHGDVKAGTCTLYRHESAEEILAKITSGCHDFKAITFYPGATLYKSLSKPTSMDVTDVLLAAGYSQADIDAALATSYVTRGVDIFTDKPADAGLEGYVYGDTYYVDTDATAQEVLQTAFDHMADAVEEGDYIAKFRAQGLNLYEGITLASIVQRELSCTSGSTACFEDQRQIAQIFYNRLELGMTLGSDVTFYYAADRLSVPPAVDIDSPYNTRLYAGLPPGPIASPGLHALDAVANPAQTEYLFFIAGDDGKVYYAITDSEHQQNVANYCQKLCSEL